MSSKIDLRLATPADAPGISRLYARNGMGGTDAGALLRNWSEYPLAGEFGGEFPLGWVLETEGEITGCLGNVPQIYELAGRRIRAAIAASWAVDPAARGKSLSLIMSFLRQPGVELWIDGSASPTASQVLTGLKMARMPIPDYAVPCFWAARPRAFAKAVLMRKAVRGASALAWPAGLVLGIRDVLRGSGRGAIQATMRRLPDFDERWDGFWRELSDGSKRLRAVRTRAVMEWRFGDAVRAGDAAILTAEAGGKFSGYAVLVRRRADETGMTVYDVADIQALGDDAGTICDLVRSAVRTARDEGVDAVKLLTGTPAKRRSVEALRPYTYQLGFWQLFYQASKELKPELSEADTWDFSPFETY